MIKRRTKTDSQNKKKSCECIIKQPSFSNMFFYNDSFGLTEFNWAVHPQQDIVTFDVPMDDLIGMQELQCL